ncbi:T9SS type A sorting domain-containing protein [Chitinophagaceae bacterium MMS25-I14]
MKKQLHALLVCLLIFSCTISVIAKPITFCNPGACYTDAECFAASAINSQTYVFSTVHNMYKSALPSVDLKMDVFSPCGLPYPITGTASGCATCKRPFLLLIHPGGFRDGCRSDMDTEALHFAQRGFVVASIDYRLGWVGKDDTLLICNGGEFCFKNDCYVDNDNCESKYADSNQFAVYRAMQDAHAAMRFVTHYADQLHIDTRYMFIGGQSAGSVAAMNLAYLNQAEINTAMPNVVAGLGNIDTVGNSFTDTFKIAGIYNNWGAVLDTSYISGNADKIPMIAFHGSNDQVVPYNKGKFLSCKYYNTSCGSRAAYLALRSKFPGLSAELFSCKGGHGILLDNGKPLYRVEKAVCFFRNVVAGTQVDTIVERTENDNVITVSDLQTWFPLDCNRAGTSLARKAALSYDDAVRIAAQANSILCSYTLSEEKNVSIRVYDMTGRMVSSYAAIQPAGEHEYKTGTIDMPGIYIISVAYNGGYIATQKVVITQ